MSQTPEHCWTSLHRFRFLISLTRVLTGTTWRRVGIRESRWVGVLRTVLSHTRAVPPPWPPSSPRYTPGGPASYLPFLYTIWEIVESLRVQVNVLLLRPRCYVQGKNWWKLGCELLDTQRHTFKLSDEIRGSTSQYSWCFFSILLVFFLWFFKKSDFSLYTPPSLLGTFFQFSHLSV